MDDERQIDRSRLRQIHPVRLPGQVEDLFLSVLVSNWYHIGLSNEGMRVQDTRS